VRPRLAQLERFMPSPLSGSNRFNEGAPFVTIINRNLDRRIRLRW